MSTATTREARTRYWQEQIEAWQSSGQSQQAFCKTHNLNYPRFGYWLRKFRQQADQAQRPTASAFVPVTTAPAASSGLSVSLPNGVEVRGIAPHNLKLVTQLLDCLS